LPVAAATPLAYPLDEPEGTREIVAPDKLNHPAVSVSNPLKYGPGGASAAIHTPARNTTARAAAALDAAF